MDAKQFDTLARSLTDRRSRRGALTAVVGGAVTGALGLPGLGHPDDVVAKKKKPCPPCTKRKKGKCRKLPDGTSCMTEGMVCTAGHCVNGNLGLDALCDWSLPRECRSGVCSCSWDTRTCTCRSELCREPSATCATTSECCTGDCRDFAVLGYRCD